MEEIIERRLHHYQMENERNLDYLKSRINLLNVDVIYDYAQRLESNRIKINELREIQILFAQKK